MKIEEYLANFDAVTKEPTLDAMKYFMQEFGRPDKKVKFIHVAGTNGKGSVCEMINSILVKAGYKVGKYISPHLVRYNERITVNNIEITDEEMSDILTQIAKKVEIYNKTHNIPVKEFEIVTTLALIYFARKKCDIVVLETGMGGIDDCTNIVDGFISIITSIGMDHMQILGNTIEEIAKKKAGIIKNNQDTIMCFQDNVIKIIKETCIEKNNTLHIVNKEDIKESSFNEEYQTMSYKSYKDIDINLKGKAQLINAAISLECVELLKKKGYDISEESVRKGLKDVIHKARFEMISKEPRIIFDGGHNEDAIENLRETIEMYYPKKRKIYIVSLLKTKDYKTVIKILTKDKNGIFIFTTGNSSEKYVSNEVLYNEAKKYLDKNIFKKELKDAILEAKRDYENDVIMVLGSFYIYKDVMELVKDS